MLRKDLKPLVRVEHGRYSSVTEISIETIEDIYDRLIYQIRREIDCVGLSDDEISDYDEFQELFFDELNEAQAGSTREYLDADQVEYVDGSIEEMDYLCQE